MPTVKRYINKPGLYIRATHGKRISTYQVTPSGFQKLEQLGLGNGGKISPDDFHTFLRDGLIYTDGSGPGEIDDDFETVEPSPLPNAESSAARRAKAVSQDQVQSSSISNAESCAAGCVALVLIPVALYLAYWAVTSIVKWSSWAVTSSVERSSNWSSGVWWGIGITAYLVVPTLAIGIRSRSVATACVSLGILTLTIVVPASLYLAVTWVMSWSLTTWVALILGIIVLTALWWIYAVLSNWKESQQGR